jgi:hypothetical protein
MELFRIAACPTVLWARSLGAIALASTWLRSILAVLANGTNQNGVRSSYYLFLGVAVEVDAGLAVAVLEAAGLAPEAHALHAAGAGRCAGAASQDLTACTLLFVVTGDPGGEENRISAT